MRIIVVESDPSGRSWLQSKLVDWNYQADVTIDPNDAWSRIMDDAHDLILLEWAKEHSESASLLARIRDTFGPSKPYIILMTPTLDHSELLAGMESGADDSIIKPIQSTLLRARLMAVERIIKLESELMKQNTRLEITNSQMKKDLLVAARIQRSFLPHSPPLFPNAEFQWGLLPCEELAGDALNVIHLNETQVGLYLLDVSGHGVAAALMAMTLIHLLSADKPNSGLFAADPREPGGYQVLTPARVATRLNQQFPMDDINGQYFTCIYGVLDLQTLRLTYAAAGHPGPVLVSASGASRLFDSTGMPIGFVADSLYEEHSIELVPGDRLYFFSDGIPEAFNKYEEQFSVERLVRTLEKARLSTGSLRNSIDDLLVAALKWRGGAALTDDVSVVGLEIS